MDNSPELDKGYADNFATRLTNKWRDWLEEEKVSTITSRVLEKFIQDIVLHTSKGRVLDFNHQTITFRGDYARYTMQYAGGLGRWQCVSKLMGQ